MKYKWIEIILRVFTVIAIGFMAWAVLTGLQGCGMNGTQTIQATGTVTTDDNVNIVFTFLTQVESLCEMQNPADTFSSTDAYNEAVANCTFKSLSLLQTQAISTNCSLPDLTPAETQACSVLGEL